MNTGFYYKGKIHPTFNVLDRDCPFYSYSKSLPSSIKNNIRIKIDRKREILYAYTTYPYLSSDFIDAASSKYEIFQKFKEPVFILAIENPKKFNFFVANEIALVCQFANDIVRFLKKKVIFIKVIEEKYFSENSRIENMYDIFYHHAESIEGAFKIARDIRQSTKILHIKVG